MSYKNIGCIQDLAEALSSPELAAVDSPEGGGQAAEAAAYAVAEALGRCRLFGVEPGDDLDGSLGVALATAAARGLARFLRQWTQDARRLGEQFDKAEGPEEEELCIGPVERRLEAWAAFVALEEAYQGLPDEPGVMEDVRIILGQDAPEYGGDVEEDAATAAFRMAFAKAGEELDAFDKALESQVDLLSLAAGTRLLNNWRAMLAPPFNEMPLWLLDGCLEKAAARAAAAVDENVDKLCRLFTGGKPPA
jgi:hypothetical protein